MATTIDIAELLIWAFRDERVETSTYADHDAVTVYWAVLALPVGHATAIRRFARAGMEPVWLSGSGPVVSLNRVRMARRLYTEWVRALTVLQHTLEGTLSRFHVTGPNFEQEPWLRQRRRA